MLIPKNRDSVGELIKKIPEMKNEIDEGDIDKPYVVFGLFAEYLKRNVLNEELVQRSFDLLNQFSDGEDPELANLVQVGVFESIAHDPQWQTLARQYLRPKAMWLFQNARRI